MVRAGARHRLRFDYFTLDRTGHTTLTGPVVYRDVLLQTGDPVDSNLSMRSLGITYEYSFVHRERFELAATIGINDTDISARARVSTQTRHVDQREDQAGPFPTLGLDSTFVLSKRFYIDVRAQYFKVAVDHLTGSLGFYEFAGLYRLRPNVSFALGYTAAKANSTRLLAAAARFHSPAVSDSVRGGYGVLGRALPAFSIATVIAPAVRWRTPAIKLANASDWRCWPDKDSSNGLPTTSHLLAGRPGAAGLKPSVALPLRQ